MIDISLSLHLSIPFYTFFAPSCILPYTFVYHFEN